MIQNNSPVFSSRPKLRNPYVVCGLSGWINAGDVATGGISEIIRQLHGTKFAEIPASRYHIYQISGIEGLRPVFKMEDGIIVESHMPKNEFYYVKNPASEHDLILYQGTEPSLYWEEYAEAVVNLAHDFGAARLYAFGGLMNRMPYTREPMISCTCTSTAIRDEMKNYNVTFSSREGPATFNQMLMYTCHNKGLDGVSFTVRVPYYPEFNIAVGYSAKSIKAVLVRLNHLMRLNINFDSLNNVIKDLDEKLDSVRQQNQQFNTYIEELEKDFVERPYQEPLDISPNEAIRFAEEFLKENQS